MSTVTDLNIYNCINQLSFNKCSTATVVLTLGELKSDTMLLRSVFVYKNQVNIT